MKPFIIAVLGFFLALMPVKSLQAQEDYPFLPHEVLKIQAYYNLGPIWVHAGDVELRANAVKYHGQSCVNLNATGYSLKKWSFIFTLVDHYQSIVALKNFRPLFYEKNTMEGGYWIHNIYHFDWREKQLKVFTESKRFAAKDTTYNLNRQLFDVLSATYYLRTLNPRNFHIGDTIPIPLITDGKFVTYKITYDGKGMLKHGRDRVRCSVYSANITNSTFFEKGNSLKIYVTADKRQRFVYGEAKIVVGSIKIYEEGYQNMKPVKRKRR